MGTWLENTLGPIAAPIENAISWLTGGGGTSGGGANIQPSSGWPTTPQPFYPSVNKSTPTYTQQVASTYYPQSKVVSPSSTSGSYTITPDVGTQSGISPQGQGTVDVSGQVSYPAGTFDRTSFDTYYNQAFQSLAPYYKQLLDEAGGDLNLALKNLEQDYQIGKRTTMEDFNANMAKLGITIPQEQTALQGNLNQRGIALTETPSGGLAYAGGGRAAQEVGTLNQDQALRQEAIQRTKQRNLESNLINKERGTQQQQQQYRNTSENLLASQKQQAQQTAYYNMQQEDILKRSQQSAAESKATYGTPPKPTVNPADAGSIQAAYPGYKGWQDKNAIIADYAATGGIGKS